MSGFVGSWCNKEITMVRIRVKINRHDGTPMKPLLIQSLCDAEVFVNKIVENREAFFVITDNRTMDTLLRDTNRQIFAKRGLVIQCPPEYEAARTVLIRNVDSTIRALSEQEIQEHIDKDLKVKVKQVIKIPNSEHLMKIVFNSTEDADKAVRDGLVIGFQKFQNRNIEKEVFIPVVPYYRCYSYEHQKRNCSKSAQMLKANDIPDVIFPDSVIRNYKQNMEREKEQESRKRQRSSGEGGT